MARRRLLPGILPSRRRLDLFRRREGGALGAKAPAVPILAVGVTNSRSALSLDDGETWTTGTFPVNNMKSAAWNGSMWAVVGGLGAASSPDGLIWTVRTIIGAKEKVKWANDLGLFVAGGQNLISRSADGITWTAGPNMPNFGICHGLGWSPDLGLFTLGGFGSPTFMQGASSSDGVNWAVHLLPGTGCAYKDFAWSGTQFCAVGSSPSVVATSPDGIVWTARTPPAIPNGIYALATNGSLFVAAGIGTVGTANTSLATSPDGITWSMVTLPTVNVGSLFSATWNGTVFCVGSDSSKAFTSPDGVVWTERTLPSGNYQGMASARVSVP